MPHSKPDGDLADVVLEACAASVIVPFQMIAPSRRKRTLEPRVILPSRTKQPAIAPMRGHAEDLADLGLAGDDLFELGASRPSMAAWMSSISL